MAYIDSSVNNSKPNGAGSDLPAIPNMGKIPEQETPEDEAHDQEAGIKEGGAADKLVDQIDDINIARHVDQDELDKLGQLVVEEFTIDETSRSKWEERTKIAIKFANQESEEKQYPWPKASNVIYPLITSAGVQFAARTYPAIIQNKNVVRGVVWGSDDGKPALGPNGQPQMDPQTQQPVWITAPGEKRERADRIGAHMSYQLLEEMPEWEPQIDMMLHMIPVVGGAVKKTYYDPIQNRNYSLLVPLLDIVWNYYAKDFDSAPRHTEKLTYYPREVEEMERGGLFLELDYHGTPDAPGAEPRDEDAPSLYLEQHRTYDLDGDGYPEPYIVTVHKQMQKVVRIVARYEEEGIFVDDDEETGEEKIIKVEPSNVYTLIPFLPNSDGSSYPIGFGHLLRPLNEAINTSLNQMFDAGHLQCAGGGFIGTSLSLASGPIAQQVGKYIPVNNKGMAIRDAVFPLPFNGPSPVLFQLLGLLLQAGKEVASIQDILTGDSGKANQPPTTVLALIEQGMKLYTAINKRVFRALKAEYNKLYNLNRKLLSKPTKFKMGDEWLEVTPDDYRMGGGVEPMADPTMVTDMQRIGRATVLMQFNNDPLINQIELRRRFLDSMDIERVQELLITQPQLGPADQMKMQQMQAEIGRMRAAELKDSTQAVLNLAQARTVANESEINWIDQQLEMMRYHLEAANTMVKAADVELKARDRHHATVVKAHTPGTEEAKRVAKNVANRQPGQPAPTDIGGNLPAMAAPSANQAVPPVPPGAGPGISPGGNGPMGPGQAGPTVQ